MARPKGKSFPAIRRFSWCVRPSVYVCVCACLHVFVVVLLCVHVLQLFVRKHVGDNRTLRNVL